MAFLDYFKETRAEMQHVSWPNRSQAIQYTLAVIVISVVMSVLLFLFDKFFEYLLLTFVVGA